MLKNPNYDTYLQTATQLQRWRDFASHLTAYLVINSLFIILWLFQGNDFFWPVYPLIGWGFGLSFQHFNVVLRGQITEAEIRRKLNAYSEQP